MDRGVAAFLRADAPRASHVAFRGERDVVAAPAILSADGMDRREVHDVEAHRGDLVQPLLDVGERAVHAGLAGSRAREELVPRAEARAVALDVEGEVDGPACAVARGVLA